VSQGVTVRSGGSGTFVATVLYGALTNTFITEYTKLSTSGNFHELFQQHGATHGQGESNVSYLEYNFKSSTSSYHITCDVIYKEEYELLLNVIRPY
jgi:hypothetical protein